ncbi:peptidoglycan-binding domain 1 [Bacillus sp. JCM 19046]|nr:peptidoglycan-binding domain 1 [Bacillus sp. JCM 19045]GAF19067.1 peptidoglycan-binding domain 1 [Bacillus sp. JCM 19046]
MAIDNQIVRSGSKKRFVEMVQKQLVRENPSALPNAGVDGRYGAETSDWVQRFQERKGLQVDGIAGPDTLGRLRADIIQRPDTSGRGVELLQEDLRYFYIQQTAVDGIYGAGTTQGVRDFQFLNNLVVDGTAGPNTLKKMDELMTTILVQTGDSGSLVRRIQHQLNEQDEVDVSLEVDGIYGSATESAVMAFQEAYEQRVDGIAGPVTMNLLDLEAFHPLEQGEIVEYMSRFGFNANGEEVTDASEVEEFKSELLNHPVIRERLPVDATEIDDVTLIEYELSGEAFYVADFEVEDDATVHIYVTFTEDKELDVVTVINIEGDLYDNDATLTAYDVDGDMIDETEQTILEFTNDSLDVQKEISELISELSEIQALDLTWNDVSCFLKKQIISEVICTGLPIAMGISLPSGVLGFAINLSCGLAVEPLIDKALEDECG